MDWRLDHHDPSARAKTDSLQLRGGGAEKGGSRRRPWLEGAANLRFGKPLHSGGLMGQRHWHEEVFAHAWLCASSERVAKQVQRDVARLACEQPIVQARPALGSGAGAGTGYIKRGWRLYQIKAGRRRTLCRRLRHAK
ncbi:MAG TPA: hypothetical protein VHM92_00490 [Allosphingosinicella sp.]|nr:hypothetical protein [Allosphingosinicella sp.]